MILQILTPMIVRERVAELRRVAAKDRYAAVTGADELRIDVLAAIANGVATDPRELAAAAMVTVDEDIGRV